MTNQAPALVHIEDDSWTEQVVRDLLRRWPEIHYAGSARTGAAGLELCERTRPAVVLLDLRLPDEDGFKLAAALRSRPRPPRILYLTGRADDAALYSLSRDPTAGFLWKSPALAQHLRPALAAALAGRAYHPPELREALARLRRDPLAFHKILADADLALLPLYGRGLTDDEIAALTDRAALTIKWRRNRIMQKLDLHRTADLMRWAREKGFVEEPSPAPPGHPPA